MPVCLWLVSPYAEIHGPRERPLSVHADQARFGSVVTLTFRTSECTCEGGLWYSENETIKAVREMLYGETMRDMLQEVTGIRVNDVVDMSGAVNATATGRPARLMRLLAVRYISLAATYCAMTMS